LKERLFGLLMSGNHCRTGFRAFASSAMINICILAVERFVLQRNCQWDRITTFRSSFFSRFCGAGYFEIWTNAAKFTNTRV